MGMKSLSPAVDWLSFPLPTEDRRPWLCTGFPGQDSGLLAQLWSVPECFARHVSALWAAHPSSHRIFTAQQSYCVLLKPKGWERLGREAFYLSLTAWLVRKSPDFCWARLVSHSPPEIHEEGLKMFWYSDSH